MDRRTFIETLTCGAATVLLPSFSVPRRGLRFGVVTDSHYAAKDVDGNRYYRQSIEKMRVAVDAFNRHGVDFVIELGDLKDMGSHEQSAEEQESEALQFLDDIEHELQRFHGPCYHVLGNHDMDCITKEQFLAHTRNAGKARGKAHYSFKTRGVKFIVLDGNFNEDRTPYSRGNFEWWKAFITQEQIDWLDSELSADDMPTVVFCHQMLDSFSDAPRNVCIGNADEVVSVLERHRNVLAVMQGHHHEGHRSERAGIHYYTFKAMIEGSYPEHNSYAIVNIDRQGNITIEGFADEKGSSLER